MIDISEVLKKFNISIDDTILYGKYMAKIKPISLDNYAKKKLILVTAISPTPAGEGKTTTTIGLVDGLNKIGKKAVGALREPSMGPVFGVKGGANGGGKSQIVPKDEINFHFTGDMHAITAANNLISACLDNNIYWGNSLNINPDKIVWKRVLDVNDRSLREVEIVIKNSVNKKTGEQTTIKYKSGFDITVASEIMAIFCLSNDLNEMRERINNIIVAYSYDNKAIYVKDLEITNAIMKILEYAVMPNTVQTLEENLCIVHGGPFANIAHGCNSVIGTKTALSLGDYVVTEAGFASDLGAEKFLDIVCDNAKLNPNAVVIVASTRSLKMHGNVEKDNLKEENIPALNDGIKNLEQHINNIKAFGLPFVVCINQMDISLPSEIAALEQWLKENNYQYAKNEGFEKGGEGSVELAEKIVELCSQPTPVLKPVYDKNESLKNKIEKICSRCYGASGVEYSSLAEEKTKMFNKLPYYVCMAKTPISLTDDEKIVMVKEPFKIHIRDIVIANGATFIIPLTGNIFRMPGLPKIPEANKF